MVRLRMEGSRESLQEILLQPGLNRLGRVEDNDFQISDDSVSSHHCQIELKDGVITVWDLDSTNGTFIDGQPIQQAVLRPGQVLSLGTVPMACEADPDGDPAPVPVKRPPVSGPFPPRAIPPAVAVVRNAEICSQHPQS